MKIIVLLASLIPISIMFFKVREYEQKKEVDHDARDN